VCTAFICDFGAQQPSQMERRLAARQTYPFENKQSEFHTQAPNWYE